MDSDEAIAVFLTISFLMVFVSVALAFIPANMARKKGYSYGGFWLFGFLCFLPALIVALVISDRGARATAQAQGVPLTPSSAQSIRELKELADMGAITQDEFTAKKRALLGLPPQSEEELPAV